MDKIAMTELLTKLQAAREAVGKLPTQVARSQNPVDFAKVLRGALDGINQTQAQSRTLAQEFQLGNPNVNLEDVMVSMQKSSIAFQAAVQVRNKLVQAYHDIMTMQI